MVALDLDWDPDQPGEVGDMSRPRTDKWGYKIVPPTDIGYLNDGDVFFFRDNRDALKVHPHSLCHPEVAFHSAPARERLTTCCLPGVDRSWTRRRKRRFEVPRKSKPVRRRGGLRHERRG